MHRVAYWFSPWHSNLPPRRSLRLRHVLFFPLIYLLIDWDPKVVFARLTRYKRKKKKIWWIIFPLYLIKKSSPAHCSRNHTCFVKRWKIAVVFFERKNPRTKRDIFRPDSRSRSSRRPVKRRLYSLRQTINIPRSHTLFRETCGRTDKGGWLTSECNSKSTIKIRRRPKRKKKDRKKINWGR